MKPYKIDGVVTCRLYHDDKGIRFSPPCNAGKVKHVSWEELKELPQLAEMFNAIFEHYGAIEEAKTFSDVKIWVDGKVSNLHDWLEILAAHGALSEVGPPDETDERVTLTDWKDGLNGSEGAQQCTSVLTYQGI